MPKRNEAETIYLSRHAIVRGLGVTVLMLATAHVLVGAVARFWWGNSDLLGLVPLLKMTGESSIPTFASTALMLLASLLLFLIASVKRRRRDRYSRHWAGLSVIFLYLAMDEAAGIHEFIGEVFGAFVIKLPGIHVWVVPFLLLTLLFAVAYMRFVWHLPARWRFWIVLSGIIFVFGAAGLETLGALMRVYEDGLVLRIIATAEESFEMLGIVLFVYALLGYISETMADIRISVLPDPQDAIQVTPMRSESAPDQRRKRVYA